MKNILRLCLLTASSVLIMGCVSNVPQNTQGTVIHAQKKASFPTIHDKQKPKKYSSAVGNHVDPQRASKPTYTAPNNEAMTNMDDEYGESVPGAISRPGTHSAFTD
jgi:hypothetical protein